MTPFLWKRSEKPATFTFQRPSPKHEAQSDNSGGSIKRVSLSASKAFKAGMTVEAAVVLPLFLFFFVNLGCAVEMIRLHGNLELALWNAGNKLCLYGYALENGSEIREKAVAEGEGEWWKEAAGVALSYTYIKSEVAGYVGEKYLEESPLSYGTSGLHFLESSLPQADDTVDIILTYQVSPWIKIPAVRPFRMQNRYYGRLWTGYQISGAGGGEAADVVYLAEYASVYHENINCTHLRLTIREVTLQEAKSARNEYGARYKECSKCRGAPYKGTVFVGKEGDCYHYDVGCSGLKRTILTVPRKQAQGYRPCSRCGGKKASD